MWKCKRTLIFNECSHILFCIYLFNVSKHTFHGVHVDLRRQLAGVGSLSSPLWVLGTELRSSGLVADVFSCCLTCWPKIQFLYRKSQMWVLLKWERCSTETICLVIWIRIVLILTFLVWLVRPCNRETELVNLAAWVYFLSFSCCSLNSDSLHQSLN